MKNALRSKEIEIRGIKREYVNSKQEIEMCRNLFLKADKDFIREFYSIVELP